MQIQSFSNTPSMPSQAMENRFSSRPKWLKKSNKGDTYKSLRQLGNSSSSSSQSKVQNWITSTHNAEAVEQTPNRSPQEEVKDLFQFAIKTHQSK